MRTRITDGPVKKWSITAKNTDCSTGPLACPFAGSLAPLTRLLASDCSLRSRPPLRSLVRSLAHFAHSLARETVNDWMTHFVCVFSIFDHSVLYTWYLVPSNTYTHANTKRHTHHSRSQIKFPLSSSFIVTAVRRSSVPWCLG